MTVFDLDICQTQSVFLMIKNEMDKILELNKTCILNENVEDELHVDIQTKTRKTRSRGRS
jgi:hypothetical protein